MPFPTNAVASPSGLGLLHRLTRQGCSPYGETRSPATASIAIVEHGRVSVAAVRNARRAEGVPDTGGDTDGELATFPAMRFRLGVRCRVVRTVSNVSVTEVVTV